MKYAYEIALIEFVFSNTLSWHIFYNYLAYRLQYDWPVNICKYI